MRKIFSILKNKIFINCKIIYVETGVLILLLLVQVGVELIYPQIYTYFFDNVIAMKSVDNLKRLIIGLLALFLSNFVIGIIFKVFFFRLRKNIILNTRLEIWKKIVQTPYDKFLKTNTSDWKSRIDSDTESVFNYYYQNIIELPILVVKILLICIIIFLKCKWLSFILVPFIIVVLEVQKRVEASSYTIHKKLRNKKNEHTQWLYNTLPIYQEIKVNNLQYRHVREYIKQRHEIVNLENERSIKSFMPNYIFFEYFNTLYVDKIILYALCGIVLLNYRYISVGNMLAYMSYYSNMSACFKLYNQRMIGNKGMEPAVEKVCEMFTNNDFVDYLKYNELSEYIIKFENVCFGYDTEHEIVHNLNLCVKKGEKIRLQGRSGAGKTTIVSLMLGLYKPSKGEITVSYPNYRAYCKNIGVIFQEPILYNTSIKENLLMANKDISLNDMEDACKRVGIHAFIDTLKNKYDTTIGENGIMLSGGQKQLIQIAKLLLKDPELIILDESTSAIDAETETRINKILKDFFDEKTCIIISHRQMKEIDFTRVLDIDKMKKVYEKVTDKQ